MKPLFVPLMKEYFYKIKKGEQDCEIRPNLHRGWNEKNVFPGRPVTFSNGYGKHDRVTKVINTTLITNNLQAANIPKWHIDAVENIYGKRDSWLIAYIAQVKVSGEKLIEVIGNHIFDMRRKRCDPFDLQVRMAPAAKMLLDASYNGYKSPYQIENKTIYGFPIVVDTMMQSNQIAIYEPPEIRKFEITIDL